MQIKQDYENVFVGFLDILGFKEMVEKNKHEILVEVFDRCNSGLENLSKVLLESKEKFLMKESDLDLKILSVSDSIILWTNGVTRGSFLVLAKFVQGLIASFFFKGVALRGGISNGPLSVRYPQYPNVGIAQTNVFGSSLVKAYNIESDQDWVGCAIDNETIELFESVESDEDYAKIIDREFLISWDVITEYPVPCKRGKLEKTPKYAINWCDFILDKDAEYIEEKFGAHNKIVDNWSVKSKLDNTLRFFDEMKLRKKQMVDQMS